MRHTNINSTDAFRALRSVALPDVCLVEDLADHLRASRSAIRSALRRGDLPGRRVGKRWLIARLALLESLASDADRPLTGQSPLALVARSVSLRRHRDTTSSEKPITRNEPARNAGEATHGL